MPDSLVITALGQAGFSFKRNGLTVLIDPYLTDSCDHSPGFPAGFWRRNYPPPVRPERLRQVDLVLCTHDHLDHLDPATLRAIARASPACRFGCPFPSVSLIAEAGIDPSRIVPLCEGKPFRLPGLTVHPIAAAHETYKRDALGHDRFLGYVLRWGKCSIFHAGDTVPHRRLAAAVARYRIDVGLLPINGRDAPRRKLGIVGNMDASEAAAFAIRHKFGLVVPFHYDLYSANGASLADFVAALDAADPSQPFKAFRPGESILIAVKSS